MIKLSKFRLFEDFGEMSSGDWRFQRCCF